MHAQDDIYHVAAEEVGGHFFSAAQRKYQFRVQEGTDFGMLNFGSVLSVMKGA